MATMTQVRAPAVVNDQLFRSLVREHLVILGNDSPGLGLVVTGRENAVVVFPRAGRPLKTLHDFRALTWMSVTSDEDEGSKPSFSFESMDKEAVDEFLDSLMRTSPVPA